MLEVILFASWLLDGLQWCLYKQGDIETEKKSKENNKTRNQARSEHSPLTDTSHSVLCYHSNETRAPIANLRNSAQLWGTPIIPPTYIRIRAVVWECGEGQTDRQTRRQDTQTAVTNIHFSSATPHAKCN